MHMGSSKQETDPETSKPHKSWACWRFPPGMLKIMSIIFIVVKMHRMVQDAAVLAQVQTHPQMVLSLSNNP